MSKRFSHFMVHGVAKIELTKQSTDRDNLNIRVLLTDSEGHCTTITCWSDDAEFPEVQIDPAIAAEPGAIDIKATANFIENAAIAMAELVKEPK